MHRGINFQAMPVDRNEQLTTARWDDLGQPTSPCTCEYRGELVQVRQKDIEAAQGNPNAMFALRRFRPWTGPEYYLLGSLQGLGQVRAATVCTAKDSNGDPRRLLIKWGDLGSPSNPGTFGYRGLIIDVKEKNIEAAETNPEAIFTATQIRPPHGGRSYYVLGKVELPT
jgi:hypothetical protein